MSDLNIALILRFVDQATAPARAAMQNVQGAAEAVQRYGDQQIAQGREMAQRAEAQTRALRGSTLATIGTGMAFYAAMRPAMDFEAQMSKVAAVSKANDEEQQALAATALELGARTRFTASQAGQGMEYLAMAGLDVNQTIAAMPGVLGLAAAAGADLADAADYSTNIMSGFRLEVDQLSRLNDVLVNTFTSSNVTLGELAATMEYAAPGASRLNVDLEQVAAMAGTLGDQGVKGERAGTSLRAMLARLAAPSTEARRALDDMNVTLVDAEGNLRPLFELLEEMDLAMRGMGTAAREEVLNSIFGLNAAGEAGTLIAAAGTGALQEYAESLRETGSAARVAEQMSDNARGAMDRLKSVTESAQIALGNGLLPVLVEVAEQVMPLIAATGQWIGENQELVTVIGWAVAGLLALNIGTLALQWGFWLLFGWVGKLRIAFGIFLVAIGLLGQGLMALALRAIPLLQIMGLALANVLLFVARAIYSVGALLLKNPLILAVAAIAALAYVIYDSWDGIVGYFQEKFDRVKDAFENGLLAGLISLWSEFNIFTLMMDAIEGLLTYIGEAFDIDLFTQGANMIASLRAGIWSVLTDMVAAVRAYLAGMVPDWMIEVWNRAGGGSGDAPGSADSRQRRSQGTRDSGGVVRPGFLYEINERGQEFFRPDMPGSVIKGSEASTGAGSAAQAAPSFGDINIYPLPGMDPRAIGDEVKRTIREMMREERYALHDGGLP